MIFSILLLIRDSNEALFVSIFHRNKKARAPAFQCNPTRSCEEARRSNTDGSSPKKSSLK